MILVGIPVHAESLKYLQHHLNIWEKISSDVEFSVVLNGPLSPPVVKRFRDICDSHPSLRLSQVILPNGHLGNHFGSLRQAQCLMREQLFSHSYTHLLFSEVTRTPTITAFDCVLAARKEVAGALYKDTYNPGYYCVYGWDGHKHYCHDHRDIDLITGPSKVAGIGFGLTLISKEVLRRVSFRSSRESADTYFAEDLRKLDIPMFACPATVRNVKIDEQENELAEWLSARQSLVMFRRDFYNDSMSPNATLYQAVERNDLGAISGMLQKDPGLRSAPTDVESRYGHGFTLLHLAAGYGHIELALLLLNRGADIDLRAGRLLMTPLHFAAREGHTEMVRTLIGRGASRRIKNKHWETPFDLAIGLGKMSAAETLLAPHGRLKPSKQHARLFRGALA